MITSRRVGDEAGAAAAARGAGGVGPAQQPQLPAGGLDERGAGLDPVAGVAIERPVDVPQIGAVDVAAYHPVIALGARVMCRHLLELLDVADAGRNAELQPLGERPVSLADRPAEVVDPVAEAHGELVEGISE